VTVRYCPLTSLVVLQVVVVPSACQVVAGHEDVCVRESPHVTEGGPAQQHTSTGVGRSVSQPASK